MCITILYLCLTNSQIFIFKLNIFITTLYICITTLNICITKLYVCITTLNICITKLYICITKLHIYITKMNLSHVFVFIFILPSCFSTINRSLRRGSYSHWYVIQDSGSNHDEPRGLHSPQFIHPIIEREKLTEIAWFSLVINQQVFKVLYLHSIIPFITFNEYSRNCCMAYLTSNLKLFVKIPIFLKCILFLTYSHMPS